MQACASSTEWMFRPGMMWLCAEVARKGCVTCGKNTLPLSLPLLVYFSNTTYSSLFTLCICLAQAFRLVSAMVHTKAGWAASKIVTAVQERKTINLYSKQYASLHPEVALFSLSLSFCHPLCAFPPSFFHQSDIRVPWQQNWALGWWLVVFHTHNDTSFARVLSMVSARWLAMPSLPHRFTAHMRIRARTQAALLLTLSWIWHQLPCKLYLTPLQFIQKHHTMLIQLVRMRKWMPAS